MSVDAFMLGVLIDELTKDAERLYKILEADTHESRYQLLGKKVLVTIDRKVYESAAGNILEKGKVPVGNVINVNMNGGVKNAEIQPDESDVKDVTVGEEGKEQSEGESAEESSSEAQAVKEERD